MAEQKQNPNDPLQGIHHQTPDSSEIRQRQGGDNMPTRADDRSTGDIDENIVKPGEKDSDAARGADKSRNGEEFEREGRNPKPFSVS